MKDAVLYSYCIPIDDGAAPNPYWKVCTLAICKPVIRRNAKIGDWVVGTGSKKYSMQNKVVYAMKITDVKTLRQYNTYCKTELPDKIPDVKSSELRRRAGDCIYYQSEGKLKQRKGIHNNQNYKTDVNGQNVLLSTEYYYFGSKPLKLPDHLIGLVKKGQGHKSRSNSIFVNDFIKWITKDNQAILHKNNIKNPPFLLEKVFSGNRLNHYAKCQKIEDEKDEICPHNC